MPLLSSLDIDDDDELRRIESFEPVQILGDDEVRRSGPSRPPLDERPGQSGRRQNDAATGRAQQDWSAESDSIIAASSETENKPRRGNLVNGPKSDSKRGRKAHKNGSKSDQSRNDQIDDYNLPQIPARAHHKRKQRKRRFNRFSSSTFRSSSPAFDHDNNHLENHLESQSNKQAENSKNPMTGVPRSEVINSNQNNQTDQAENALSGHSTDEQAVGGQVEDAANKMHFPTNQNGTVSFGQTLTNSLTKSLTKSHRKVKRRKTIRRDNQFSLKQQKIKKQPTNSNGKSFARFHDATVFDLDQTQLRMPFSLLLLAPTLSPFASRQPYSNVYSALDVGFWSARLNASDPTSARLMSSVETVQSNAARETENNKLTNADMDVQLITRHQAHGPTGAAIPGQLAAQLTDQLSDQLNVMNSVGSPTCTQANCFRTLSLRTLRSTNETVNRMQHMNKSNVQLSKGLNKTLNQVRAGRTAGGSTNTEQAALQFAQNLMLVIYLIIFLSVLLLLLRVLYIAILRKLSRRPHGTASVSQNSARHSSQLYTQNTFNPAHLGYQTGGNNSNSNVNVSQTYGGRSEANSISGGTASFIGTLTGNLIAHNAQLNRKPDAGKQTKAIDSEEDSKENKLAKVATGKSVSPTSQLQSTGGRTDSPSLAAARPFSRQSGKFTDLNIISDDFPSEFSSNVYANEDELSHA